MARARARARGRRRRHGRGRRDRASRSSGVPGHSAGHVAFCADGKIFSGDLLFEGSVGRVDLPGGDWETLLASIKRLVDRYGPDAVVYPGHGEPTTLGRELATNPFLGELRAR